MVAGVEIMMEEERDRYKRKKRNTTQVDDNNQSKKDDSRNGAKDKSSSNRTVAPQRGATCCESVVSCTDEGIASAIDYKSLIDHTSKLFAT